MNNEGFFDMKNVRKCRWTTWSASVLSKVENASRCEALILKRQAEVDDDQDEVNLIAENIKRNLRRHGQKPDKCHLLISTRLIKEWISEIEPVSLNKVTPLLKTLGIPELRKPVRTSKESCWVWKGLKSTQKKPDRL